MKLPGPDHPISIAINPRRIRVSAGGTLIAETDHALTLQEAAYRPVQYIPREDVDMTLLSKTDRSTHCPYKGDACYYSIKAGETDLANAVWSYEAPFPAMAQIAGHLAFYPGKVMIEEL